MKTKQNHSLFKQIELSDNHTNINKKSQSLSKVAKTSECNWKGTCEHSCM